ncbi:MAG: GyrI-like domain-containing protein [Prevotellaceae bacterium]|jgi:AraC family transcriptional regulator|nr:GyrI-like domain-containing protein [Prevotellaceae bacterium]
MNPQSLEEIAARTNYQTKHAASKAFKKHFGIPPSAFRKQTTNTSLLTDEENREAVTLNPVIREIDDKQVVYIRIVDWYGSPESYRNTWKQLGEFGVKNNLLNKDTEWTGLSFDDPTITQPEKCRFYACFTTNEIVKPTVAFGVQQIQGGLYAIFTLKGAYSGLTKLYYSIYMRWLPNSEYVLRGGKSFEVYLNHPDRVSENELLAEIYVPVKKKEE